MSLSSQLQYMGREYPGGPEAFRIKCHNAFLKNSQETDPEKITKMINLGEFVAKELEALYHLKKYRAMKNRYYSDTAEESVERMLEKLRQSQLKWLFGFVF